MDNIVLVGFLQRLSGLGCNVQHFINRHLPRLDFLFDGFTFHILHADEILSVPFIDFINRGNIGMIEGVG
jgi:hypothetical protein